MQPLAPTSRLLHRDLGRLLQRFGEVHDGDMLGAVQVGNCAAELEDTADAARSELHLRHIRNRCALRLSPSSQC